MTIHYTISHVSQKYNIFLDIGFTTYHHKTMQTFLPYPSLTKSASCLDYRRLGKQRVEATQIHNVIMGKTKGWIHHPAVKMWTGYPGGLALYTNTIIQEWIDRGYTNNMPMLPVFSYELPPWFGDPDFHASHRSNLLRKDPNHYSQFNWTDPNNLPYVWPTQYGG